MSKIYKIIDIELLEVDKSQPRKSVNDEGLEELSISIKENGILQPIIVSRNEGKYKIIIGERRYRAAKLAEIKFVPVLEIETTERNKDFISLIENIQRENLTAVEEAYAYKNLMDKYFLTQKELSEKIGKNRSHIANLLRILDLEQEILNAIHKKEITVGHAKVILSLKEKQDRYNLYLIIIKKELSVRESEEYVKGFYNNNNKNNETENIGMKDPFLNNIKEFLVNKMQTKINIKGNKEKGKIEINYFTENDLKRIISMFDNPK